MTKLDIFIISSYVVLLFGVGILVGVRETAEDFLILSRKARFPLVLFSIVSTWVGVGMFLGATASGYDTGVSYSLTGAGGALVAIVAVSRCAPMIKRFGDRFDAHTLGDFFRIRYSINNQLLVGGIVSTAYLLFTAVQFTGLAAMLNVWTDIGFETAVLAAALTTVIYTAFAGIKSDFYTDAVHFWVMVLVLFGLLLPTVWQSTGGVSGIRQLPESYFSPFAFGGVPFIAAGVLFGTGVAFISMEIWQRIYASESAETARRALIGSVAFVVAFYVLAAYLGMATKIVEPSLANRDIALFVLMKRFLRPGVLGLGIAAFVAVFMSSANTMIMVVSATLTKDFYKGIFNRQASQRQLLVAGRCLTFVAGLAGVGFSFVVRDIVTLSVIALFMLLVFLPAVIGGFFWRRATSRGAFLSVLLGFLTSLFLLPRMPRTAFVPGFVVSLLVFVAVSFLTAHSPSENVHLR
ncbi:MAG: sodium:solute symporter family protein [Acidobacteriia bacterium]|nr:sodium:solute symporter family protein [Terriglobia bacterium]